MTDPVPPDQPAPGDTSRTDWVREQIAAGRDMGLWQEWLDLVDLFTAQQQATNQRLDDFQMAIESLSGGLSTLQDHVAAINAALNAL